MAVETPIQSVREALYSLLKANITEIKDIYKMRPTEGVKVPSIVMQKIGGPGEKPAGLGQVYSADRRGVYITLVIQIDVFHNNTTDLDAVADRVLTLLVEKKIRVGDSDLEIKLRRSPVEIPEGEAGEKLYHVSMDFEVEAPFTWS